LNRHHNMFRSAIGFQNACRACRQGTVPAAIGKLLFEQATRGDGDAAARALDALHELAPLGSAPNVTSDPMPVPAEAAAPEVAAAPPHEWSPSDSDVMQVRGPVAVLSEGLAVVAVTGTRCKRPV
jgi:hypothetical protein